jgi:ankyrin repeat protein
MAESGKGLALGVVVVALAGLGGVLYYSISQVSKDMPVDPGTSGGAAVVAPDAFPLQVAVERADANALANAVKSGAKLDAVIEVGSKSGLTPLMVAALSNRPDSVAALLKAGAKVSARGKEGKTALIFAAGWSNAATLQAVLDGKPNIDERTDDRLTALMMAASRGEAPCLKVLIDAGADVNAKNKWGQNALMAAARAGDAEKVGMLVAAGANVLDGDLDGATALHFACASGVPSIADVAKILIEHKADVNSSESEGVTPLMRAADNADAALIGGCPSDS